MNVLLIGSGGREHALAWAISASPLLSKFYCAPGNPGIAQVAELAAIDITSHAAVIEFCKGHAINFVVVGPEAPLVAGLVDDLKIAGIKAFGPSKFAAQLEGSKGFTKDICAKHNIPTAAYGRFTDLAKAQAYLAKQGAPIVIKADGLAAGKGETVAMSLVSRGRFAIFFPAVSALAPRPPRGRSRRASRSVPGGTAHCPRRCRA